MKRLGDRKVDDERKEAVARCLKEGREICGKLQNKVRLAKLHSSQGYKAILSAIEKADQATTPEQKLATKASLAEAEKHVQAFRKAGLLTKEEATRLEDRLLKLQEKTRNAPPQRVRPVCYGAPAAPTGQSRRPRPAEALEELERLARGGGIHRDVVEKVRRRNDARNS